VLQKKAPTVRARFHKGKEEKGDARSGSCSRNEGEGKGEEEIASCHVLPPKQKHKFVKLNQEPGRKRGGKEGVPSQFGPREPHVPSVKKTKKSGKGEVQLLQITKENRAINALEKEKNPAASLLIRRKGKEGIPFLHYSWQVAIAFTKGRRRKVSTLVAQSQSQRERKSPASGKYKKKEKRRAVGLP